MSSRAGMGIDKGNKPHNTGFYMETLILVIVFTVVIVILTKIFAVSGELSRKAGILTSAVHLAENAAEAVAASDSAETLLGFLDENGNAGMKEEGGSAVLQAWYDEKMNPVPESEAGIRVEISWVREGDDSMVQSAIAVYWQEETGISYGDGSISGAIG